MYSAIMDSKLRKSLSTPEGAYVFGFIWGDGSFSRSNRALAVEAVEEDLSLLEPAFQAITSWHVYRRQREGRRPQMTLRVQLDPAEVRFFEEVDLHRKSHASAKRMLEHIPEDLHAIWYRGYFDADGNFYCGKRGYTRQATLSAAYEADLSFFKEKLSELGIRYDSRQQVLPIQRSSSVRIANREGIECWGRYIYGSGGPFLPRKKATWDRIITTAPPQNLRYLEHNGEVRPMAEWARQYGLSRDLVGERVRNGWPVERALMEPPQKKGSKA